MSKGRSIRLFLADGTPGGIITAEIMNWTGHVLVGPRSRLADLIQRPEAGRTGIYILAGTDPEGGIKPIVYLGEPDNVAKRLAQHNKDEAKEFWEQTCVVTSKDQNLTKAHIRYLESRLISIAKDAGRAKLANDTAPDFGLLPEADLADMEYFIEQLRIVLPVLGLEFLRTPATALINQNQQQSIAPPSTNASTPGILPTTTSPVFELKDTRVGLTAKAVEVEGEMIVLAGSQARKNAGVSLTGSGVQKRQELIKTGVLVDDPSNPEVFKFTANTPFNSPSQSSSLILARSANGRTSWIVEGTERTYARWQEEQVSAVEPPGGEE